MSWHDQMGSVSFRGVSFHIQVAERGGGRRSKRHEFAFRDPSFTEDLGRKFRSFPLEGYVIGEDYIPLRDELIKALETEGPGELVHPYYGSIRVVCTEFRVRESADDGGVARFSITFEETQATPAFPASSVDATGLLNQSATAALNASGEAFMGAYSAAGQPAFSLLSLSDMVRSAANGLDALLVPVFTGVQELALFKDNVDRLYSSAQSLVRDPANLFAEVSGILDSMTSTALGSRAGLSALIETYYFTPPLRPPATTATRIQERANYDALLGLLRQAVVIQAARLAPGQTYDSYEDAAGTRNAISDLLELEMGTALDDAFPALMQLRADLLKAVPGNDTNLAHLVTYTPNGAVPSLVLAHQLYGNVDRELDLVARNNVSHPGFVPGLRPLEVLSHG